MSSWGNNDNAANAPLWAAHYENLRANSTNISTFLYDNTTANNVAVTLPDGSVRNGNKQVGLFLVDNQETVVAESGLESQPKVTHSGWILETTGLGGRAGRVQTEVLVCLNTAVGDGDGQTWANVVIQLAGPSNETVTHGAANSNTVTFTVTPTLTGNTAANLTYQWQVNNNQPLGTWVPMTNGTTGQPGGANVQGVTTSTLSVTPWTTNANNYVFRCIVSANDEGVTATSANGLITIL